MNAEEANPAHTGPLGAEGAPLPEEPKPEISPLRTVVAVLLVAAAVIAGVTLLRQSPTTASARVTSPWYGPYVDVTLTPTYAFENPTANPVRNVLLGFVVSSPGAPCRPSWGGYYTLAQAERTLELDQRVRQVQVQGGEPIVSFGGQRSQELSAACQRPNALSAAYMAVLRRYHLDTIDIDVEGQELSDTAANIRRANAIATVQRRLRANHRSLSVWLTLPVETSGLPSGALNAIHEMLAAHVVLAGVNIMALDFAPSSVTRGNMLDAAEHALQATHDQLEALYQQDRIPLPSQGAWGSLGVTVMIGQNDYNSERFTIAQALRLREFVVANRIGRLSMWSLNRDTQCGTIFAATGIHSNTCSGIRQAPLEFTHIFSRLPGTVRAAAATNTSQHVPVVVRQPADVQAQSPYPIWNAAAMYQAGYKVVWHHNIYQAKWFSQNNAPDAFAQSAAQTPWLLIGPVLAGEHFPRPPRLSHRYPRWSPTTVYRTGNRVIYEGYPYEARWYVQATLPDSALPVDEQSPWRPLYTIPGEPRQR